MNTRRAQDTDVLLGHLTKDCTENRKFDTNHIPDKCPDEAWDDIKAASAQRDLEDFREVCFPT